MFSALREKLKYFVSIVFLLICQNSYAVNAWYWGKATQILTYGADGSFIVYVDNTDIGDVCFGSRINVLVENLGAERTKAAMSIALSAFHSGKSIGVVLDLPTTPDTVCEVPASSSQGVGISN
jgi:hypothetical protein